MRYGSIQMADILTEGPEAGRFSFSFEPEISGLVHSINVIGLVNPPLLRSKGGGFDVVCGFKRVLACKRLRLGEINALVYKQDELSDEKCLRFNLIDNDCRRMSPVERAIALGKFSEQGYDAERLAEEIAPELDLPPSGGYVENYLRVLSLEREILRAVHDDSFGIEQAFCLLQLEAESRLPLFHILLSCRANLNETRELISLIPDVAAMKGVPVVTYIDIETGPILGNETLPPRKKLESLRGCLMKSRYPRLARAESKFNTVVSEMKLGEHCRVSPPKYFEGTEISIVIRVESAEQLTRTLRRFIGAEAEGRFQELFSIIRGRERP